MLGKLFYKKFKGIVHVIAVMELFAVIDSRGKI